MIMDVLRTKQLKQVIIQRIREAGKNFYMDEYGTKEGEIISGIVQKSKEATFT